MSRGKERLDQALVRRGLARDADQAQRLLLAGQVLVQDRPASRAGDIVPLQSQIRLRSKETPWVSRGGIKLHHALQHWQIDPSGWCCLDVGASTGGFTDVLLASGAVRVYAVDVGYGQLAWKLACDARVINLERHNVRFLTEQQVPDAIDFLVMDVSFIGLSSTLPIASRWLRRHGCGVLLVKPQFELERQHVAAGGIVQDTAQQQRAVLHVTETALSCGLTPIETIPSPIAGAKGNREFLLYFHKRD
ncbi:MAG: TlyA family RNA methyltransferase [Magnetococcales bacterium]|nr:TlyA family RNA methyltransferase [Magnetococcales bacterium]